MPQIVMLLAFRYPDQMSPARPKPPEMDGSLGSAVANRLRQVRDDLGLSQAEMAKRLARPFGTYQRYEQGREPKMDVLVALIGLGIDVEWLLTGRGWMRREEGAPRTAAPHPEERKAPRPNAEREIFNEGLLKVVVTEIERALIDADADLPPTKKAELVAAVYVLALAKEQAGQQRVDRGEVIRLVRLAG